MSETNKKETKIAVNAKTNTPSKSKKTQKINITPHALLFFIGGAGDQEPFVTVQDMAILPKEVMGFGLNGENYNITYARNIFIKNISKLIIKDKIKPILIGYHRINDSKEIDDLISLIKFYNQIDKKYNKKTLIYIIGHSLGGWNGAHLTQQLDKHGYDTEMLITLDPVGVHYVTSLRLADIYKYEPTVKAKLWINIRTTPKSSNFPDWVASAGGQWSIPSNATFHNYKIDMHHENADGLFTAKIIQQNSAMDMLINSLQVKMK